MTEVVEKMAEQYAWSATETAADKMAKGIAAEGTLHDLPGVAG